MLAADNVLPLPQAWSLVSGAPAASKGCTTAAKSRPESAQTSFWSMRMSR
jgi:hypothetical protein